MMPVTKESKETHGSESAVSWLAFWRSSKTRFFDRDCFISAWSAAEMLMSSEGMTTEMPSSLSSSLNSLAVKAACRLLPIIKDCWTQKTASELQFCPASLDSAVEG